MAGETNAFEIVASQANNVQSKLDNLSSEWSQYLGQIGAYSMNLELYGWYSSYSDVRALRPNNNRVEEAAGDAYYVLNKVEGRVDETSYSFSVADPLLDVLGTVPAISVPSVPEFNTAEPTLNIPAAPSSTLPGAPGAAPEFSVPAIPTAPTVSLPAVPTFSEVPVPEAPELARLSFDEVLPSDELTLPVLEFEFDEAAYESALGDKLKAKLLLDLDGGYGIEPVDEQRLWERLRDRELRNVETNMLEAGRQSAARGFMLPQGIQLANVAAARRDGLEKISSAGREIALKRADLYAEHRKITLSEARELEQMNIAYWQAVAERALRAAVSNVELGVQLYNVKLARFNVQIETYRAAATVYETRIRAQLNELEQFKTRIEAASLTIEQQATYARIYEAQIRGAQAVMDVYRVEMDGARTAAEIERLRLDGFKSAVDAYGAQVGARATEFQMYEAQIRGETAKLQAYRTSVDAYGQRVEAVKTAVATQQVATNAAIDANRLKLEKYRADMDKYRANVGAETERLRLLLARDQLLVGTAETKARTAIALSSASIDVAKTNMQSELDIMRSFNDDSRVKSDALIRTQELKGRLMDSVAQNLGARTRAYSELQSSIALAYDSDAA